MSKFFVTPNYKHSTNGRCALLSFITVAAMLTVAEYYRVLDIAHHIAFVIQGRGNEQPAKNICQYNKMFCSKT
jgi:hypothetical protein